MPEFAPGESKTAVAPIIVSPSGLSCESEIFLGPDEITKVATSGLIPFTSTGAEQAIRLPIVMPATEGTYHCYIDVYAEGILIAAYQAIEDVSLFPIYETATLHGYVYDENSIPLSGVLVQVCPYIIPIYCTEATTDENGYYRIDELEAKEWPLIRFRKDGYHGQEYENVTLSLGLNTLDAVLSLVGPVEIGDFIWSRGTGPMGLTGTIPGDDIRHIGFRFSNNTDGDLPDVTVVYKVQNGGLEILDPPRDEFLHAITQPFIAERGLNYIYYSWRLPSAGHYIVTAEVWVSGVLMDSATQEFDVEY